MPIVAGLKRQLEHIHLLSWLFEKALWLWDNAGKVWPMLILTWLALRGLNREFRHYWEGLVWADRIAVGIVLSFGVGAFVLFGKFVFDRFRRKPHATPLFIVSARWGPTDTEYVDITKTVRRAAAPDHLDIPVDYRVLGDPKQFRGRGKYLRVVYSFTREIRVPEAPEPLHLILPEPSTDGEKGKKELKELAVFTVQDARFSASPAPFPYRNIVQVILTNSYSATVAVWSPLWENTTGEVPAQDPLGSGLDRPLLGYPRREGELEAWSDADDSLTVEAGQTFRCWIGLLEPQGESIRRRLQVRKTGTLVLPIRVAGDLAIQRLPL